MMKSKMHRLSLALTLALIPLGTATASTQAERIAQLEARIARLEAALGQTQAMAAAPAPAQAVPKPSTLNMPNAAPGTQFFISGFVKLDAMLSNTSNGELADGGIGRDLYVPGLTPVGGADEATDLDLHAKFSRLIVGSDTALEGGQTLQTRIEGDFFGNGLGDERFNNAAGLVLRHAYINYNNRWLIGQSWSTFMDPAALPESSDLIGPTDGTVFVRQPQLRYTSGNWMFALENPETTITALGGGARISSDDNVVPDFIARYNHKTAAGSSFGIAAIARELRLESTGASGIDDRALGVGLSSFGKLVLGSDDIRFGLTAGRGLGRYVGLNANNDVALDANGEFDAIDGVYGYLGWRHLFNTQLRSNVFYARANFSNPSASGVLQTANSQSLHVNLFYSPFPKWDVGSELIFARRELENGQSGDLLRLHTSVKYSF